MGKRTEKFLMVLVFLLLFCCGCGKEEEISEAENTVTVDLMQGVQADEMPDKSGIAEVDSVFYGDTIDFAVDLLKENVKERNGENVIISPVSVLSALAMTANGAKEDTQAQMLSVFAKSQDMDSLNRNMKAWTAGLTDTEEARLGLANAIWFQDGEERLTVEESFLKKNAAYYDADIYKALFDADTLKNINAWAAEKTGGKIKKLVDSMDEDAVMYLVNTVVFDADWGRIYQPHQVSDSVFTDAEGEEEKVPFMYSTEKTYLEDENATGFIKPYKEGYRFAAILPNQGISPEEYLETIDGEHFIALLSEAKTEVIVHTGMPKFQSEYETELSDTLAAMGIENAFDWKTADFRGMGTYVDKNIYIDSIIHKTFLSVGELGTEAVAATVEEAVAEAAEEPEEIEIYQVFLRRPFIYAIVEEETNVPIFIGILNEIT